MTDNSPATDEEILRMATEALKAASRIRAETAENSGEAVAWELISNTNGSVCGSRDTEPQEWDEVYAAKMNAKWVKVATPATGTVVPSVANSRAEAIGVKPLEWLPAALGHSASHGLTVSISSTPIGEYCVVKGQLGFFVTWYCQKELAGVHETKEAAKAAAQADYEQRIRSALLQQEGE